MKKKFVQRYDKNPDELIAQLEAFLIQAKIQKRLALKLKLYYEHILLSLIDRDVTDITFSAHKTIATLKISIQYGGAAMNPLETETDDSAFSAILYQNLGLESSYTYCGQENIITGCYKTPPRTSNSGALIAVLLAVVVALLLRNVFPEACMPIKTNYLDPLFSMFIRALTFIICPLVLFSQITNIGSFDSMKAMQSIMKPLLKHIMALNLIAFAVSLTLAMLIWGQIDNSLTSSLNILSLVELSKQVPSNIFEPIIQANILQLIAISSLLGLGLLSLGKRKDALLNLFEGMNDIFMYLMNLLAKLLPGVIFISFLSVSLSLESQSAIDLVLIIAFIQNTPFLLIPLHAWSVARRTNTKVSFLLKNVFSSMLAAYFTVSTLMARSEMYDAAEKKLGMDKKLFPVVINMNNLLLVPANIIYFTFAMIGIAKSVSGVMLLSFSVLVVLLSIASPKVPGGGIIVASVMLAVCGVDPAIGLPLFIVLDLSSDSTTAASNVCFQMLEAYAFDHMIKQKSLQSPAPSRSC